MHICGSEHIAGGLKRVQTAFAAAAAHSSTGNTLLVMEVAASVLKALIYRILFMS